MYLAATQLAQSRLPYDRIFSTREMRDGQSAACGAAKTRDRMSHGKERNPWIVSDDAGHSRLVPTARLAPTAEGQGRSGRRQPTTWGANSSLCCTVASWSLDAAGDIEHPSAGPPIR